MPCRTALRRPAVSLTVGKLKLMIEKLLRVRAASQALLLLPPLLPAAAGAAGAAGQPEDITDEDSRELRYFSPVDGSRWGDFLCISFFGCADGAWRCWQGSAATYKQAGVRLGQP